MKISLKDCSFCITYNEEVWDSNLCHMVDFEFGTKVNKRGKKNQEENFDHAKPKLGHSEVSTRKTSIKEEELESNQNTTC